jgi:hypothetical protein
MNLGLVATVAAIAAFTALEALLSGVHHWPGSVAVFGVLGCVAIVAVAKALGAAGLKRPESVDE